LVKKLEPRSSSGFCLKTAGMAHGSGPAVLRENPLRNRYHAARETVRKALRDNHLPAMAPRAVARHAQLNSRAF
jgi:hypothetical protein